MNTAMVHLEKILDESLPQATRARHSRQALLNLVFRFKRNIRRYLRLEGHFLAELKTLPNPTQGKFCNQRILNRRRFIEGRLKEIEDGIIDCGEKVWALFESLDPITTLHEKAQIFGVHHGHVERLERKDKDTGLAWLALRHVEYTGKTDFVPGGEIMPFFEALSQYQIKTMMTRTTFKQRHSMLESFFGPIPHCREGTLPDGRRALFEFRSPLRTIDSERTIERKPKLIGFIEDQNS